MPDSAALVLENIALSDTGNCETHSLGITLLIGSVG
jgi:hypothetical protein